MPFRFVARSGVAEGAHVLRTPCHPQRPRREARRTPLPRTHARAAARQPAAFPCWDFDEGVWRNEAGEAAPLLEILLDLPETATSLAASDKAPMPVNTGRVRMIEPLVEEVASVAATNNTNGIPALPYTAAQA